MKLLDLMVWTFFLNIILNELKGKTFGRVKEFMHVARVLAPFVSTSTSSRIICALQALHPLDSDYPYSDSLMEF
jgi:hypothetical protein